jgi:two-component system cell cycle sensor histidine kinase/response regulator CckA
MTQTSEHSPNDSVSRPFMASLQRHVVMVLPVIVLCVIAFGWFVALRSKRTLEQTVISAYQETQLEIVRSVGRSIRAYVSAQMADHQDLGTLEQRVFRQFVAPIHLLQNGDAWIYAPDHIVFDLSSDFPEGYRGKSMAEIFALQVQSGASHYEAMADDVMNAREGVGWYIWLPQKGREIAAWSPVRFGSHVWTIGLSTPLPEILRATGASAQTRFLFSVMAWGTALGLVLAVAAIWSIAARGRLERMLWDKNVALQNSVFDLRLEVEKRRETERAMQDSKSRLETLVEAIPDIICFKDLEGRNLVVNKAFEHWIGLPKAQILGRQDSELFAPDLAAACRASDEHVLRTLQPYRTEEQSRDDRGRICFFDSHKVPLFDNENRVIGLVGVARDVTERKLAEQERQQLGDKLMRAEKMEAIGTLAGGVAHDLNNILAGLVSYPELLLMGLPEDSPLRKPLLTIQKSGERAAGIVQDLLTLARRGVESRETVNMNDFVREFIGGPQFNKLKLEHPVVKVEVALDPHLLPVSGSPVHLSKAVMNLILNAFEAMPSGGRLRIATENIHIDGQNTLSGEAGEGDYVKVEITDTGKGIPSGDLLRIFEPFYSSKVLGRSGSGLGLSVVWGVVRDHHGFIDVRSNLGEGTTFTLLFPASRGRAVRSNGAIPREHYQGRGETILVVDDVELQREIASEMLKELGYVVITAASGQEAVSYLEKQSVHLVVLDMIMPNGMDGLETYEAIIKHRPGQKAVITSGFSETERVRQAQQLGAGVYIKKPYLVEKLGIAVRNELDRHANRG